MKRFSPFTRLGMCLLLTSTVSFLPRLSSFAQGNFASDVTGNIITTSDIAGGLFSPLASSSTEGFASGEIADAVDDAAAQVRNQLQDSTLPPELRTDTLPAPTSGLFPSVSSADYQAAQVLTAALISPTPIDNSDLIALAAADSPETLQLAIAAADFPAETLEAIANFQTALNNAGLPHAQNAALTGTWLSLLNDRSISAAQLQAAIAAYQAVTETAPIAFLQTPPAEFQVLQAGLEKIIVTAIASVARE